MKANFNIAKNVRNSRSISALGALRKLQSLGLLLCALLIGSLQVWGAVGDLVTSVTPTTDLASGTTYQAETGTDWAVNVTNNSAFGTNAKSGNDSKLMLSNNEDTESRNTAIASALASYTGGTFTDETQYVAALIGLSSISNVGKVTVTYTGTNGGNPGDMWVLYTTNSGTSYTVAGHTSTVSSGTNITFSTVASAQYAVVFKRTAAFGLKGATISFYEGAAAGFTVTINKNNNSYGTVTQSSVTGVTSGTSISASGNVLTIGTGGGATNVTATPNSGYKFNNWTGIPGGGTVTGNVTVTANFAAVSYSNYRTLCSTTDPSLSVSPASLNELDYIVGNGPSAAKSFSMSGSNLESGTLTVTAPTNFQVSKASGSGWASSITFTDVSGTLAATTVYVRLATGKSAGEYSGNVSISGCGLESAVNVALSGTVFKPTIIATPASVSWSTAVGVAPSPTSVTVTGSNLKANITAVKGGTNASDFTISPASITQTSGSASGSITITYTGAYNAVTTKTATLTLSSTDADDVVVNITFNVINDPNLYFLTDLEDIGPKDKVIIVSSKDIGGVGEVDYALANATVTKAPDAVDVKSMISGNRQTLTYSGTDLQWNINYNSVSHKLVINRDGDDDVFLALKNDNNGVQVGDYAYKTFQVVSDGVGDGYLFNVDLSTYGSSDRVMGVYNNDDWRCYGYTPGTSASIPANISDQTFTYYAQPSTDPYVTLGSSFTEFTYEYNHGPSAAQSFTVSGEHLSANLVVTAPSNYQVCKTIDGTYTSSVSFTPSTGTVSEQTVYIRLVAGLAVGEYDYAQSSGLSVTSTGADAVKSALEGSVTPESFTVTATSSNVSHGTVSPASQSTTTNMTITASPVDGYRVVSGAGGYTVTAGTASVTNNGDNTFTVTPSTDCTVRINFEAIPTHKVTYWATGTKIQESDVQEGAAIPDQTTETASGIEAYCGNRDHFVGWTTNSSYSHATDAPAGMITGMSPGGTMSTSDVNYYAVYANTGGTSNNYSRVTDLSQLSDGDVVIIVSGSANQLILQQTASGVQSGGTRTATTSFTDNTAANHWTLEKVDSNWKLCKDASNKLTSATTPAYTAYGNSWTIEDSQSDDFYFIRSGTYYLEYYSGWKTYQITGTPTSSQNATIRAAIYKQDPGYVDYTTQCCSLLPVTGLHVSNMGNNSVTLAWTLPASTTGITKFQVVNADNSTVVKDNISTSATNSGSISGLTKCQTYHFKVVSYSSTCTVSTAAVEFRPFGDAHTVTFNYNGGSGSPASFTTSCDGTSTTLPTPDARDGYTFLGWWSASSGGNSIGDAGDSYTVTGNTTIWAHWAQNFTVHYDRHNGTAVCSDETCGAGLTYTVCTTEPTRSGYIFAGWKDATTSTVYNAGDNFTMPSANVTLDAQWTDNWRNLTFNVPEGGGSASGVPSGNHVRDGQSFTMPTITGKSDSKWCWTFLGWTETAPNGSGRWDVTPSYIAGGATSGAITSDKTYYAVYSKTGAGASGDNDLTGTDIATLGSGGDHAYGTTSNINASDGSTWSTNGYVGSGQNVLRIKYQNSTYYHLKTPTTAGNISTITINYQAVSSDSRTIYFNTSVSTSGAVSHTFDGTYTSGAHEVEVDVSSLESSTIYIFTSASSFQINSVNLHFGPPAVYGYTLDDCPCVVEEFDLTYDANATNFPGSTTTCTGVTDYRWEDHENEYTICSTEPTLDGYKFTHWATNANGSGTTYNAGEVITCVGETPITLYAQYERVYTVTFNNQGVTTPVTQASEGASIDVPSATSPCSAEWAFVGWSETAIAPMSMLPTIEIASGTSTYTPTADKTLYAIYRKTSTSDAFVAGMSGAYKITNGSTVYAGACNNNKLPETDAAGAAVFYIKYTSADGGKYTIQQSDGKYLKYSGSSTGLALNDAATPYYWTMAKNGTLWRVQSETAGRYLQHDAGTGFKAYNGGVSYTDIAFVAAEGQYYYRTMSCATEYDITFHANGTTINWAVGHPEAEYQNLADATVISTFPTATFAGWTFLGWRRSDYTESTTAPASSGIFGGSDGTSGNNLTIASANEDLYPVFTRFEDNEPFDDVNGGDYYIYFMDEGSDDGYGNARRVYAATYSDSKRYHSSALCDEATEFTFTKLANGNWTIFDKTKGKYLYGIDGDDDLKQRTSASGSEWTLTLNGNQFDAFHVGTSYGQLIANGDGTNATFMNYRRTNIGTNPEYHRVYLGGCTNRTFTTNPSTTPNIEIHGQVKVTSTATKSVKARSVLTVSASNISTENLTVTSDNSAFKFCLTSNGTYTASVNIPVVSQKVGITPIYIEYTPAAGSTSDGIEGAIVTVSDGAGTPTSVSTLSGDVQGRHLPENFVIAAKLDDKWYALPANCTSSGTWPGILIEVDNASDPTSATLAPNYTKFGMREVATSRYAANGSNITFTERISTETANNQKTLYNGTTTSIQVYAQWYDYHSTNPEKYEWVPSTDDFKDYTLTSADGSNIRPLCMNTSGVFGTYTSAQSYGGKVRLLPATFYEEGPVQIVEWKANSVVVMYTGSETSATTRVGSNSASSAQTLSTHKLTHGVYELTTDQSLASNDGKTLLLGFGDTKKAFDIPVIITGNVTATDGHANQDAVIVSGGKLTAAADKYSFRNVYVYGGGKLKIASGTSLGVNNIILRAGGIATSGIGSSPSATYEYVYPQVELGGTLTSTLANIKYEYITDYDHWYHLCLPFDVTYTSITYPTEYYGNNVTEGNKGSWIVKRYDGATRATGNYNAWVDIETDGDPKTIYAGHGYIFWGAPKKVSVGGAAKERQKWGIQRMTMSVAAAAATTAETANKTVSDLSSYASVEGNSGKNNDQGWNLIGNPYMVNLTGLNSTSIQVGQLVHTDTHPWDGKWEWDNTDPDAGGLRYVTIPDNHFDNYEAKTMSWFTAENPMKTGRTFFVQIAGANTSVAFASANRASLLPALYAHKEQSVDIETGIVMSDETHHDEVNFWIKDGKTEAYESNADYPKTPNGSNFNIYGVHEACDLSWIAISPAIAEGSMAIGYQVPTAGEYTLSLSETYVSDKIDHVFVTDHAMSPEITTDLMDGSYEFMVNQAETNKTRFTVSIQLKEDSPGTTTDIGTLSGDSDKPKKFIYRDKMYILRGGQIYDSTGKMVKEINK